MSDLVAECFQGGSEGGVEVHLLEFRLVQPGEIAQVLDDGADPSQALGRALEQSGEVLAEVGQVDLLLQAGRLGGEPRLRPRQAVASFAVLVQHAHGVQHVPAKHGQVVDDEGERVVDLVGHPRRQPPQARELLRLDQTPTWVSRTFCSRRMIRSPARNRTRSSSRSNGLVRKSSAPASIPSTRSSFWDFAVRSMA